MRLQWTAPLAASVALAASTPAWAGHAQEREGFWIGFGGGYGSAKGSCDECVEGAADREGSGAFFLKLGGTLNSRVLLGAEIDAWVKKEEILTLTLGNVSGTVTFYPQASSGFFLKGGLGMSYVHTEVKATGPSISGSKEGWGFLAGLGYDLRVSRNVSITPTFNYCYGRPGNIDLAGERGFKGWRQDVLQFAIGLTFH